MFVDSRKEIHTTVGAVEDALTHEGIGHHTRLYVIEHLMKSLTPPPVPKVETLHVLRIDISFTSQITKEAMKFHNAIKSIMEKMEENEPFHGKVRVHSECQRNYAETEDWSMTITSPPIPENHPLRYKMEGALFAISKDKKVNSWGSLWTPAKFPEGYN
jgi:hypothetical protein